MLTKSTLPKGWRRHKYSRIADLGVVSLAATDSGRAIEFTLQQVPQVADLLAVFDAYSIDRIDVHIMYKSFQTATTVASSDHPTLITALDYDDANSPATSAVVRAFDTAEIYQFGETNRHYVRVLEPRASSVALRNSSTASLGQALCPPGAIFDAGSPDISHYGFKYFLTDANTTGFPATTVHVYAKFHFSMYAGK